MCRGCDRSRPECSFQLCGVDNKMGRGHHHPADDHKCSPHKGFYSFVRIVTHMTRTAVRLAVFLLVTVPVPAMSQDAPRVFAGVGAGLGVGVVEPQVSAAAPSRMTRVHCVRCGLRAVSAAGWPRERTSKQTSTGLPSLSMMPPSRVLLPVNPSVAMSRPHA